MEKPINVEELRQKYKEFGMFFRDFYLSLKAVQNIESGPGPDNDESCPCDGQFWLDEPKPCVKKRVNKEYQGVKKCVCPTCASLYDRWKRAAPENKEKAAAGKRKKETKTKTKTSKKVKKE